MAQLQTLINQYLDRPVFFITPNLEYVLGLASFLPQLHIITNDHHSLIETSIQESGVKMCHLPSNVPANAGSLLGHPDSIAYITQHANQHTPLIIAFKPSPKLEHLCRKYNFIPIVSNSHLARQIENKVTFAHMATEAQLPIIPSHIMLPAELQKYSPKFPMVIQTNRSWAGKGSFLINNQPELESLLTNLPNQPLKVSQFIPGHTITLNGCISTDQPFLSPIARQINITSPHTNPLSTYGRTWPAKLHEHQVDDVAYICSQVANMLQSLQYQGFFGLDLLISEDKVYLVEINPRFTASESFYTRVQLHHQQIPLSLIHMLTCLNLQLPKLPSNLGQITGTQITFRNEQLHPVTVKSDAPSGLFNITNNQLEFTSSYIDIPIEPHVLQIRVKTGLITSGSEIAVIETQQSISQAAISQILNALSTYLQPFIEQN